MCVYVTWVYESGLFVLYEFNLEFRSKCLSLRPRTTDFVKIRMFPQFDTSPWTSCEVGEIHLHRTLSLFPVPTLWRDLSPWRSASGRGQHAGPHAEDCPRTRAVWGVVSEPPFNSLSLFSLCHSEFLSLWFWPLASRTVSECICCFSLWSFVTAAMGN